ETRSWRHLASAEPSVGRIGANAYPGRRHPSDDLATGNPHAQRPRHRAAAGQGAARGNTRTRRQRQRFDPGSERKREVMAIASQLWAERAGSAELISNELGDLRARLTACGLNVKELECNRGTPPQGSRTAILAIAREYKVPIYENAELVKMLARLELGDSIPQELYLTIAEIIAFAWRLKGKFPVGFDPDAGPVERDITPR
nr:hypothetical protein [Tanacetum cinerariifolium]